MDLLFLFVGITWCDRADRPEPQTWAIENKTVSHGEDKPEPQTRNLATEKTNPIDTEKPSASSHREEAREKTNLSGSRQRRQIRATDYANQTAGDLQSAATGGRAGGSGCKLARVRVGTWKLEGKWNSVGTVGTRQVGYSSSSGHWPLGTWKLQLKSLFFFWLWESKSVSVYCRDGGKLKIWNWDFNFMNWWVVGKEGEIEKVIKNLKCYECGKSLKN